MSVIVATLLALLCLRPGRRRTHTKREAKAGAKPKSARQVAAEAAAAAADGVAVGAAGVAAEAVMAVEREVLA